ncbi:small GTP-binding protein, putative [Trichomonas vaginalis G3]|uniref:Small GTP-binding protein, putative n=1 Tax=Trichomonas vaginalis (strain ATCC PRA-98 / G3) TaxID=412133 RepID=A2FJ75_TRIV3|nr:GTPase protein [Trichomonas vaginalis G3]EAX95036.1 small GTP-binding protein, putative [Trichomonas vaginalis G3]KAI5537438.1 GTPase protein [Trichomonas vaginalis G3]|eukprot:XP_001307966.1 small GTP-binding protein [Trichomonas vaginalis G3]
MEYKVPFVGNPSVGKTSIISRYASNVFNEETLPTVGACNFNFTINLNDEEVVMNVWDTAGQERFRSLVPLYTRGSSLIVITFDISEIETFKAVDDWYQKLRDEFGMKCPIFLVANKMDLDPKVPINEIKSWAQAHQCQAFFTSAMTNRGIEELFTTIAQTVSSPIISENMVSSTTLDPKDKKKEKSGCC